MRSGVGSDAPHGKRPPYGRWCCRSAAAVSSRSGSFFFNQTDFLFFLFFLLFLLFLLLVLFLFCSSCWRVCQ